MVVEHVCMLDSCGTWYVGSVIVVEHCTVPVIVMEMVCRFP